MDVYTAHSYTVRRPLSTDTCYDPDGHRVVTPAHPRECSGFGVLAHGAENQEGKVTATDVPTNFPHARAAPSNATRLFRAETTLHRQASEPSQAPARKCPADREWFTASCGRAES